MSSHTDTLRIPRAYISYAVLSCMVAVFALFGYVLVQSVMHAVALRAMSAELAEIERDTHALEMRQVAVIQELTRDYALQSGYVALSGRLYAESSDVAVARR
ncbi:hypothetical protein A3C89_01815 [Candidatus Kaiserbacteria bacterium RIFCSPHIGHO2_02_FULL_50_50]|uniref:Cell division protein FtsL n=1 Tax=Candidatus Kaiserbacteria bacterium RIFCSPHIGHO2_02_FULL_50_50 TaxID=1798492 RepID=A0A1F6DCF0_9BACT|nr:MAG: hypothetical protein A3C89_01815 [Candidatus Kaiserbacteria bacterium RIFCSPHIGHO2_02_FULL_50_50]OGG89008.1 MAG: hypothetical protein A3G62_04220 [Candidatus Kaiserbacteria bacterium RIFCSPLOWO2_12_FULL_50_10]